jgi:putative phosphoribosyl transferase
MDATRLPLRNRTEAGRDLGALLRAYRGRQDLLVLALPRGGVPIACELARSLGAPLDLLIVRKLGVPGQEELAMGAIASGGVRVLKPEVISALGLAERAIERVEARERQELERRERAYRGSRPRPAVEGKCVFLVDDGVATGATMRAAIAALRQSNPAKIVVAVPVAPPEAVEQLGQEADEVVCLATPEPFFAIGRWYVEFPQLDDAAVRELLAAAWTRDPQAAE